MITHKIFRNFIAISSMSSSNAFHQHDHHHRDPDLLPPDLVYDYYAAAWEGPQGRLEVCVIIMIMMIIIMAIIIIVIITRML